MKIPKGSTVILNVWGLHHDPKRHAHPDIFDPERYAGRTLLAPEYVSCADPEQRDHYGYGSGRRICPGIHLAERNLFLAIAKLLWAFRMAEKETTEVSRAGSMQTPRAGTPKAFCIVRSHSRRIFVFGPRDGRRLS